ncbi:hypothetical protein VBApiPXC38_49 [Acinetobacter phage VB_ApiP_XC38]|uniref:Uncharacterized protein n=1 Tax=Acinetobacter phage VB_ApiP_XC38 TaxID=2655002 RepID=A0A5P8PR51_9CAUD|nr:hypothetical protein KNU81_gp49 [Acinetobacter phage VB_ApiP_XC38]QFR59736.1 hypothetical protein VBApiPXC38_49 [Acinetobacter phage VB_ApiP_XC38]
MIKSTLEAMYIAYIAYNGRILSRKHYNPQTPIRILEDGTGWILVGGDWIAATFYVKDVLQKLDLKDKPT